MLHLVFQEAAAQSRQLEYFAARIHAKLELLAHDSRPGRAEAVASSCPGASGDTALLPLFRQYWPDQVPCRRMLRP